MIKIRMRLGNVILGILLMFVISCGGNDTKLSSNCTNLFETFDSSMNRYDLHLSAFGFQDYVSENLWLITIASMNGVELLSGSRLEIKGESFELVVPDGVTSYGGVGVFVDLNGNSRCDVGEPSWEYTTGTPTGIESAVLSPNGRSSFSDAECIINGLYNMNEKASCNSEL